jgi:hypothetical protein
MQDRGFRQGARLIPRVALFRVVAHRLSPATLGLAAIECLGRQVRLCRICGLLKNAVGLCQAGKPMRITRAITILS